MFSGFTVDLPCLYPYCVQDINLNLLINLVVFFLFLCLSDSDVRTILTLLTTAVRLSCGLVQLLSLLLRSVIRIYGYLIVPVLNTCFIIIVFVKMFISKFYLNWPRNINSSSTLIYYVGSNISDEVSFVILRICLKISSIISERKLFNLMICKMIILGYPFYAVLFT